MRRIFSHNWEMTCAECGVKCKQITAFNCGFLCDKCVLGALRILVKDYDKEECIHND